MTNKQHSAQLVGASSTGQRDLEKDAPGTAVAEHKEGGALATASDFGEWGGFNDIGRDDVAVPFLTILQPLSPQVMPGKPEYLEAAKAGMILQTVTKELYQSILVVVADYKRSFIEWVPRSAGGGFRGEHGLDFEPIFKNKLDPKTGKAKLDDGNDLVDTRSFFVITSSQTEDGGTSITPALISMASTQVKAARNWMNLLMTYVPPGKKGGSYPPWAAVYSLSSAMQSNDKGNWFGWKIARVGANSIPELIAAAEGFHKQVRSGTVNVDRSALDPEQETATADGM